MKRGFVKFRILTIFLVPILMGTFLSSGTAFAKDKVNRVTSATKGSVIEVTVQFPEPVITKLGDYDCIEMEGIPSLGNTGEPVLPVKGVNVLIPAGKDVKSSELILGEKVTLPGTYNIEPAQKPIPLSYEGKVEKTLPKDEIYKSKNPYPKKKKEKVTTQKMRGYRIEIFKLSPIEYIPQEGALSYYKSMTLKITLEKKTKPKKAGLEKEPKLRKLRKDRTRLEKFIANSQDIQSYDTEPEEPAGGGVEPTGETGGGVLIFVNPAESYQYVVITNEDLKNAPGPYNFQALCAEKNARGITTNIVTTEWIYANYSGTRPDGGTDNATKIRNFIIDAYNNWETEYILLGGDATGNPSNTEIIPCRKLFDEPWEGSTDATEIPSDIYYCCLDGTMDYDADGVYGEKTDGISGGETDLLAEVYIGRAPIVTEDDLTHFIQKTLSYKNSASGYLFNTYMLGEHLGFGGASEYATDSMEEIRLGSDAHGYTTAGFATMSFLALSTLYDAPGYDWPKNDLINIINNGVHVLNHLGHANVTYDMKLSNSDADSLINTNYFFGYSQGCLPGAFDEDCIVEHFVKNPNGAFAFVGNSRYGWGAGNSTAGPSQYFNRQFWDAVFGENIYNLGKMNEDSKEDNLWCIGYDANRWCYLELNLFGDPELMLHFVNSNGCISFDKDAYNMASIATVYVLDTDLNADSLVRETVTVEVTSGTESTPEQVVLAETGVNTGCFSGQIQIQQGSPRHDGVIQVNDGDTLVATYYETSPPATKIATAVIDGVAPVISNVAAMPFIKIDSTRGATITWQTDEPSTSTVYFDTNVITNIYGNLLQNSGFDGSLWPPASWSEWSGATVPPETGGAYGYIYDQVNHSAPHCVVRGLYGTGVRWGGFSQDAIIINPGDAITASAWLMSPLSKPLANGAEAHIELIFFSSSWKELAKYQSPQLTGASGWVQRSITQVAPAEATYARINLVLIGANDNSSGEVYFDDALILGSTVPSVSNNALVKNHSVNISGLNIDTLYYFVVKSVDAAGNIAVDDNGEASYQFVIKPPVISVTPSSLSINSTEYALPFTQNIQIGNIATEGADLSFDISVSYLVNWITSIVPVSGSIPYGDSCEVSVTIDPSSFRTGVYTQNISITNNDPAYSSKGRCLALPVTLNLSPGPAVYYRDYQIIDDWTGASYMVNGDGAFNPGETIELALDAENKGSLPATGVSATLSLAKPDSFVTIIDNTISMPDIPTRSHILCGDHFVIQASPVIPNGRKTDFLLVMTDNSGHTWHSSFSVRVCAVSFLKRTAQEPLRVNTTYRPGMTDSVNARITSDNNGNVYALWQEECIEEYAYAIYFNYSNDYGRTWYPSSIKLSENFTPSFYSEIASDNHGNVYAVWSGKRNGLKDIYFNYSNNYGHTWQPHAIRLDTNIAGSEESYDPQIKADEKGNVYVVWLEGPDNGGGDVCFNYSNDYGHTWQASQSRLNADSPVTNCSLYPQISSDRNGNVYVVWMDGRNNATSRDVFFNYSNDYGRTWQANSIRLDTNPPGSLESLAPQISSDNHGNVYVVWVECHMGGKGDVYFNYSNNYGHTWQSSNIQVDTDAPGSEAQCWPEISSDNNGNVYVAWSDGRHSFYGDPTETYFNCSHDYGHTWQANDIRLNGDDDAPFNSNDVKVASDGEGNVYVVWATGQLLDENGNYGYDISLSYSTDYGRTWQPYIRGLGADKPWGVAYNFSAYPEISINDNGDVYIARVDLALNWSDIYFFPFKRIHFPELDPISDVICQESTLCNFNITGRNPKINSAVDLFFSAKGLPTILQGKVSSAAINSTFNPADGITTGVFTWTPDAFSAGVYDPFVFVARDPATGVSTFRPIAMTVSGTIDEVVPGESIQTAAINTIEGGEVYVGNGVYQEDVIVQGKGIHLIGENALDTIIKGNVVFCDSDSSLDKISVLYKEGRPLTYSNSRYNDFKLVNEAGVTAIDSEITVKNCIIEPDPGIFGITKFGNGIQIWNLYGNPDISPVIENCRISNADTGIYLYSQAFGGGILGEIKNNELDNNNYGIVLRMHKEKPLIEDNEIKNSINGIHITYEDGTLLTDRLSNIIDNTFSGNADNIWCDEPQE